MPNRRHDSSNPNQVLEASQIAGYFEFLDILKDRIRTAQVRAALASNLELVVLYWHIGRGILARQQEAGWGAKVIERLAADLRREFPGMTGLSRTNLLYMRGFGEAYSDEAIVQQLVGRIPWGHNIVLLDKLKDPAERRWYAERTIEHGWSRNVLVHQIEGGLHARQGRAITNFERTLPTPQSDLAVELVKAPSALLRGHQSQDRFVPT